MRTQSDNRRVVSKTEYAGIMGVRLMGYAASSVFFIVGIIGMILTGIVAFLLLVNIQREVFGFAMSLVFVDVIAFLFCLGLSVMGRAGIKSIQEEEEVVPLTRQTALDIPAEESLVRASSANTLADETILLRAAQAEPGASGEELLRPHSQA